ncbi:hypothetical protein FIU87_03820 [Bacillus sp. THAF10]|uniref:hypothetical protein n=1 Tax=Bacillus sp. THAF10 TaxID=2587848 RepID=UPI00126963AB|nr:hypothetical protein [Bacillus sp. THAF10]QFT87772.1 hypothetical protein FIU87_03820 [Bacillus sp. THAF10]
MLNKEPTEKVVTFEQTESTTKTFRHDLPISDQAKEIMLSKVFIEFSAWVFHHHFAQAKELLEEFIQEHHLQEEKQQGLLHNMFWWRTLYMVANRMDIVFVDEFIAQNLSYYKDKPLVISWLKEWEKATSKFYYVGHVYNDRNIVVVDMLTEETHDVVIFDPAATLPKNGEIVMGTLLPIGDGLYFPIIDFYHFDYQAREHIVRQVKYHLNQHSKHSSIQETFIHVLSQALQIEHLVVNDVE